MQKIEIHSPFITLGQLLKKIDWVSSGGEVKIFLQTSAVKVNEQTEVRRGRKIYPEDVVEIEGYGHVRVFLQPK